MLVALFICFIGCLYLFRSYLQQQIHSIALYKIVGLTQTQISGILLSKIVILSLFSWIFAQTISYIAFMFLKQPLSELINMPFEVVITWKAIVVGFIIALLGPVFFLLSHLYSYSRITANNLLQQFDLIRLNIRQKIFLNSPAIVFIILLSIYLAKSYSVGLLFILGMGSSIILLFLMAKLIFLFLRTIQLKKPLPNLH